MGDELWDNRRDQNVFIGDTLVEQIIPSMDINNNNTNNTKREQYREKSFAIVQQVLSNLGISRLINVPVVHCYQAYAIVLEFNAGWKLVYSGDTRPCPSLNEAGQGATLLIHEATFENEKLDEAERKLHSTVGEALQAGIDMNAHRTILTHFSQRYPNLPRVPNIDAINKAVLAFDFMHFKLSDLGWLPSLIPALLIEFPPEINEEYKNINNEMIIGLRCSCCPLMAMECSNQPNSNNNNEVKRMRLN